MLVIIGISMNFKVWPFRFYTIAIPIQIHILEICYCIVD